MPEMALVADIKRRVQQGRHLGDDLIADEAGQHEDVEPQEGHGQRVGCFLHRQEAQICKSGHAGRLSEGENAALAACYPFGPRARKG